MFSSIWPPRLLQAEILRHLLLLRLTAVYRSHSLIDISKNVVCIGYFHLKNVTIFHVMDVSTRFSAAHAVTSISI